MTLIPEINPNQSIELLKELHILTRDGKLNQDSRRKLKQVYHLFNFIEPHLQKLLSEDNLSLVDHGAGKSYLGFIIYDLFFKKLEQGKIYGIEFREDLIKKSIELAERLKFSRMQFVATTVADSNNLKSIPQTIGMVTALHACDTATDDAIDFGLNHNAKYFILIPCCQAELASVFRKYKNKMLGQTPLSEIWRHPIHSREFGSHLTNVLRCLRLEAAGYQVTVTELVGWEHSMKNELIVAEFKGLPGRKAKEKLEMIINEFGLDDLRERFLAGI